jgi:hypothetical protein
MCSREMRRILDRGSEVFWPHLRNVDLKCEGRISQMPTLKVPNSEKGARWSEGGNHGDYEDNEHPWGSKSINDIPQG